MRINIPSLGRLGRKLYFLVAVIAIVGVPSAMVAAPIDCAAGATLMSVINAAGGLVCGSNTFSNFAISNTGGAGFNANAVSPSHILVTVGSGPAGPGGASTIQVMFTPDDPALWNLSSGLGNGQFNMDVDYDVAAASAWYYFFQMDVSGAPTGTASFSGTKNIVTTGQFVLASNAMHPSLYTPFTGAPLSGFHVKDNIHDDTGGAGTTGLAATMNTFVVPEPMTMSLMSVGLLGLGVIRRRIRK